MQPTDQAILEMVSENEATGKVAELYQRIREGFQIDFVPNFFKAQATRPDLLENTWEIVERVLIKEDGIPRSVKEMMFTAISRSNNCRYCEAAHLAFCKVLGVDQKTREDLIENIDNIRPERTRDMVKISVKMGSFPVQLDEADYQTLRDYGVSSGELQEMIAMCSFASYANITADALRVPIDEDFNRILSA